MQLLTLSLLVSTTLATVNAFAPPSTIRATKMQSMELNAIDTSLIDVYDMTVSRTAFFLCLFGATGSAAMGRVVIPKTWASYWDTQSLIGSGTPLGGREMNLLGYPEPVYENDIKKIISNNMTIPEIIESFPIENQIPGYLRYESLAQANPDVQPMAVRAVFDGMALGITKNQVHPRVAAERLNAYKDVSQLEADLKKNKTLGITALVILLGLIGAADYFTLYHFYHGWFPTWPGFSHLPGSLIASDTGIFAIPDFWVDEIPEQVSSASGAFPM